MDDIDGPGDARLQMPARVPVCLYVTVCIVVRAWCEASGCGSPCRPQPGCSGAVLSATAARKALGGDRGDTGELPGQERALQALPCVLPGEMKCWQRQIQRPTRNKPVTGKGLRPAPRRLMPSTDRSLGWEFRGNSHQGLEFPALAFCLTGRHPQPP